MSTILVVDDMPLCLESITEILRKEGFHVLACANGEDVFSQLSAQPVDLLLLDVVMPRVDGLTIVGALRKSQRWRSLPVILLTDAADEDCVRTAARLGVQGYLLKSHFTVATLLSRVNKALAEAAAPAAAQVQPPAEAPQATSGVAS